MESHRELALDLFRNIQREFPNLKMDLLTEHQHVEVMLDIPSQPGLLFKVNLNLQGDELHLCAGDHFWVEWFPCTDSKIVENYLEAVRGILSGRHRIIERFALGVPATASLEKFENGKWVSITSWGNIWGAIIPSRRSVKVLRNIMPDQKS